MSVLVYEIGAIRLTRVGYIDVAVDAATVGLTPDDVEAVAWAAMPWIEHADAVRVGAAAWVIEDGDATIVVDPMQAADDLLREGDDAHVHQERFAALLADAGFPRERVTHAVGTHIEGIGMFAWMNDDGSWGPFFPNAPWIVPTRDVAAIDDGSWAKNGTPAFTQLREQDVVRPSDEPVTTNVRFDHTGSHSPGHRFVRIQSGDDLAIMLGHLALSPLHLATGECPQQHFDPPGGEAALARVRAEDALLLAPLWPEPAAGYWRDDTFIAATPR
jgi:hypothetical protein